MFSYFSNPERPATAFIAPVIGIILALLTPAMKKGNRVVSHLIVGLTFIFTIVTAIMAFNSGKVEDESKRSRRIAVFSIMSVAGLGATGYYVARFVNIKKNEKLA